MAAQVREKLVANEKSLVPIIIVPLSSGTIYTEEMSNLFKKLK
jgi:hypothetical protein